MGFFDKKYCDVCGEKIGLLGNRKLEDGNLCKDCAAKLSPFFSERKSSTVEEIKQQLAYREENQRQIASFRATRIIGDRMKVMVDELGKRFVVTSSSDILKANPDIIPLSDVISCNLDLQVDDTELKKEDAQGKEVSYNPPRFCYSYNFYIEISVKHPWFSQIRFRLNSSDIEIVDEVTGMGAGMQNPNMMQGQAGMQNPNMMQNGSWVCSCGMTNTGRFCQNCGSPQPAARHLRCSNCGWEPTDQTHLPKFCPQCGSPF